LEIIQVINELKEKLVKIYGSSFIHLILYGSWARGEANENSDIDLLVVLDGKITPGREIDRMIDVITDLNLKYDVLLSVCPVSQESYLTVRTPFFVNVRKEGVMA
jgi:predicted nucleotidyltransferase